MNILEMAMAAKMAGGGTGPIDPKRLPEGYPYKEQSEKVLVDEAAIALTFDEEGDKSSGTNPFSPVLALEDGVTYSVEWDGVKYTCPCAYDNTARANCIGNLALTGGADNGMPFFIMYHEMANMNVVAATGKQEAPVVKVSIIAETIHTMAPEFLPTGVGGGLPAVTTSDNGKFLRAVNGAWTAVAMENAEGGSY